MENLTEYLVNEHQPDDKFSINDNGAANWALRAIAEHLRRIEGFNGMADAEIAKVEGWREKVVTREQRGIEWLEGLLADYLRRCQELDPKLKRIDLPNGRVRRVKQQPEFVRDEDKLLEWARSNARQHIAVKEALKWGELKKSLRVEGDRAIDPTTGEVVPGVTVVDRPPVVRVEVSE